jgi:hypothetical protein
LEISDSLKKRNSFSKEKSLSIWENYNREGLKNIKGLDTLFIDYDDILNNPFPNFVRMLKFLGIKYDEAILKKMYFTVDPEVKHSEYDNKDFIKDKDVTDEQKELLRELDKRYEEQLKEYPLEKIDIKVTLEEKNNDLKKKLSDIGKELDKSRKRNIIKEEETEEIRRELIEIKNVKEELVNKTEELRKQNRRLTEQNKDFAQQNKELTEQNKELAEQNKEITNQNKELHSIILDKNTELNKIYNSKSWKLTKPVRNLSRIIRKK